MFFFNFMPELPEVETCKNGILPHIIHQKVEKLIIRQAQLRWPIPENLANYLEGQTILNVERRAKYIIISCARGYLILHLGMSGHFKICDSQTPPLKHDHLDIIFSKNLCLRYHDPRRFGAVLWTEADPNSHPLLKNLGPEPLSESFNPPYFLQIAKNKQSPIKNVIMNQKIVVGIGNIYANEALFLSRIHPLRPASSLKPKEVQVLIHHLKSVLEQAIFQGGTTLNDFKQSDGKPGYFKQHLLVYGRQAQACPHCSAPIEKVKCGQRSTFFCPKCQKI